MESATRRRNCASTKWWTRRAPAPASASPANAVRDGTFSAPSTRDPPRAPCARAVPRRAPDWRFFRAEAASLRGERMLPLEGICRRDCAAVRFVAKASCRGGGLPRSFLVTMNEGFAQLILRLNCPRPVALTGGARANLRASVQSFLRCFSDAAGAYLELIPNRSTTARLAVVQ